MKDRLVKFGSTAATLLVGWLLYALFTGRLDVGFAVGCLIVSGVWQAVTCAQFGRLLHTYCTYSARLKVLVPLVGGVTLSVLGAGWAVGKASAGPWQLAGVLMVEAVAIVELVLWWSIYNQYRANKLQYEKQGHGPLPKGVLLKPHAGVASPGSVLLSAGDLFAPRLHASVDHAELAVRNPETGMMQFFSVWIGHGTVINIARRITMGVVQRGSFYIILQPVVPLTEEENEVLWNICLQMQKDNVRAKNFVNRGISFVTGLLCRLPMPKSWKAKLAKVQWDGYGYTGLVSGFRSRWAQTCFGSVVEAMDRLCKEMKRRGKPRQHWRNYGVGAWGLGTGLFDPLVVTRLLEEPTLHLVCVTDDIDAMIAANRQPRRKKPAAAAETSTEAPASD